MLVAKSGEQSWTRESQSILLSRVVPFEVRSRVPYEAIYQTGFGAVLGLYLRDQFAVMRISRFNPKIFGS